MASNQSLDRDYSAPSMQDRITALLDHQPLFETISEHPQAGIYQRNGKEWHALISHIEGDLNQSWRAVQAFIQENARPGRGIMDEKRKKKVYRKVMRRWERNMFRHGTYCYYDASIGLSLTDVEEHAVGAACRMAKLPPPSTVYMDKYRANSGFEKGSMRAANGELSSMYGQMKERAHFDLCAQDNEGLEPMEQFIVDWLMNPCAEYIVAPFQKLWSILSSGGKRRSATDNYVRDVDTGTISFVARAMVSVLAILSLAVPIGTLDTIEQPKLRIIVMTLFAQAFATSAQFMESRNTPVYALITAYFQVMVIFVGTTSG